MIGPHAHRGWLTALIAGLAVGLVVGVTGPATAGGLTKSKVRHLVAKVVAKEAPKLSVSHAATAGRAQQADRAGTADSATRANRATSAATADVAGDSELLAGAGPAAYLDRVAYQQTSDHPQVGAQPIPAVRPILFTVPDGVDAVRVTGVASFYSSGATSVYMYVASNSSCHGGGTYTDKQVVAVDQAWAHLSVDRVIHVIPGQHSFTLCVQAQNNTWLLDLSNPAFVVETVAIRQ